MDLVRIAEDDRLRSLHMRVLIQQPVTRRRFAASIPKLIMQYWHDSDAIPADVYECLASWESLASQGFTRVLFDDARAESFLQTQLGDRYAAAFSRCHHPAMRCDYFRLCYIYLRGGFYVDADDVYAGGDCHSWFCDDSLKVQPLCYDVASDAMVEPDLFLRRHVFSSDWIYYANNNPLVAPPFHPVIRMALARATGLLLSPTGHRLDIQSTTGPGNLTACLVRRSLECKCADKPPDFTFLTNWEATSISRWPLSYRNDERNWRLWRLTREGP